MLYDLVALPKSPTAHVCIWRDGDIYLAPPAAQS